MERHADSYSHSLGRQNLSLIAVGHCPAFSGWLTLCTGVIFIPFLPTKYRAVRMLIKSPLNPNDLSSSRAWGFKLQTSFRVTTFQVSIPAKRHNIGIQGPSKFEKYIWLHSREKLLKSASQYKIMIMFKFAKSFLINKSWSFQSC